MLNLRIATAMFVLLLIGSRVQAAPPAAPANAAPIQISKVVNPADIIFMYQVNKPIQVAYSVKNASGKAVTLTANFTFIDRSWKAYSTQTQTVELPVPATADATTDITFTVDPKGLPFGQYSARLMLKDGDKEVTRSATYVGVISATDLPKAKPGEFLFGLDACLDPAFHDPRLLRFTQLMGTDIIRGGIASWGDRVKTWDAEIKKAAPIYQQYNLKLAYDVDPPDNRVKDRDGYLQVATKHLEMVAREYKDMIPFFELGNEPDIGFFQGPMSLYADDYLQMRAAIKRGNPDAVVVNGGWAYETSRIDEFYGIVKPADVDVIAYHGHGDVTSEERAYQKVKAIATQHGFGDKTMCDTETGIAAKELPQEEIQARVCVEKFAFAQSMHEPFLHWFRLRFEQPGDYGCTWWYTQPRPAVLSYRATVETLRGYKFKQTLQLPYSDTEAYQFEQIDGPGRACVLWVNGHVRHQAYLHLAGAPADVANVATGDIYGNHHPFNLLEGNIAALTVSEEPVWLLWSANKPFDVAVEPPLIQAPPAADLQANTNSPLTVQVRNPLDRAVSASLEVQSQSDVPLTIAPTTSAFRLQPHEVRQVALVATVGDFHPPIKWADQWTVFCRPAKTVDLASITSIPDTLPGDNGPVTPTHEILRGGKIDLAKLCNYKWGQEKAPAIVMAYVDSDADRTVTMGAGADFWMEWFVNGQPAFDDLAAGNGPGYSMLDHPFKINLKKGQNLLVCRALAGSQGFTLAIGSPEQLEKASGAAKRNGVQLKYTYNDTNTVSQSLDLNFLRPVEALGDLTFASPLDAWERFVPNIVLDDKNLTNLHFKNPDQSLWWKGYGDLSAVAWLRADKDNLYLLIKVTDDVHRPASDPTKLNDFDSIGVAVSPTGKDDITNYRIGLVGGQPTIVKFRATGGLPTGVLPADNNEIRADVTRDDATTTTIYRVALRRTLTTENCYLNFLVNDNDTGVRKQYMEWKPGMETLENPANWYRIRFGEGQK